MAIDWRGYELRPDTPAGGAEMTRLFPADRLVMMRERMRQFSRSFGIEKMGEPTRIANTRKALAMTEAARDAGKLDALRAVLMDAYWQRGLNLEDDAVLRALAVEAGLPPETADAHQDPALDARVTQNRREAVSMGVTGIPTFFFKAMRVVGCQPYEELAAAAEAMGAKRR